MTDRALVSLAPAIAGGFIVGLIVSIREMNNGSLVAIGAGCAAAVFLLGFASVVRAEGPMSEKGIVGVLRAALSALVFALVYMGMIEFLRNGQPGFAVGLFVLAAACAYPLATMRVRRTGGDVGRARPHAS